MHRQNYPTPSPSRPSRVSSKELMSEEQKGVYSSPHKRGKAVKAVVNKPNRPVLITRTRDIISISETSAPSLESRELERLENWVLENGYHNLPNPDNMMELNDWTFNELRLFRPVLIGHWIKYQRHQQQSHDVVGSSPHNPFISAGGNITAGWLESLEAGRAPSPSRSVASSYVAAQVEAQLSECSHEKMDTITEEPLMAATAEQPVSKSTPVATAVHFKDQVMEIDLPTFQTDDHAMEVDLSTSQTGELSNMGDNVDNEAEAELPPPVVNEDALVEGIIDNNHIRHSDVFDLDLPDVLLSQPEAPPSLQGILLSTGDFEQLTAFLQKLSTAYHPQGALPIEAHNLSGVIKKLDSSVPTFDYCTHFMQIKSRKCKNPVPRTRRSGRINPNNVGRLNERELELLRFGQKNCERMSAVGQKR